MSPSPWNDPRITAYVLDELPVEDRDAFERDLESSPELVAAVDEARGVTGQLAELYAAESMPPLDSDRRDAILAGEQGAAEQGAAEQGAAEQGAAEQGAAEKGAGEQGTGQRGAATPNDSVAGSAPADPTLAPGQPASDDSFSWRAVLAVFATAAVLLLLVGLAPWLNQHRTDLTVTMATEAAPDEPTAGLDETRANGVSDALRLGEEAESLAEDETEFSRLREEAVALHGVTRRLEVGETATARETVADDQPASLAVDPPAVDPPRASALADNDAALGDDAALDDGTVAADGAGVADKSPGANTNLYVTDAPRGIATIENRAKQNASEALHEVVEVEASVAKHLPDAVSASESARKNFLAGRGRAVTATNSPQSARPVLAPVVPPVDAYGAVPVTRATTPPVRRELLLRQDYGLTPLSTGLAEGTERYKYQSGGKVSTADAKQSNLGLARGYRAPALGRTPRKAADFFGGGGGGFGEAVDDGRGPGIAGDRFEPITDNAFKRVSEHPLSTFSVDVDTASYSKVRDYLFRANQLPRPDAVRIEELVNYFEYDYEPPADDAEHPFAARATIASCPWNQDHRLARIALKGKTMDKDERPDCNLVFLLDTSGSMDAPNKLPLVLQGMQMLINELRPEDRVAITVYAGSAGLVLDSTSAKKTKKIRRALTELSAGGSTNGGAGISLAYQTARDHFITEGVNRVILCTDGDFNVGTTGTDELVRMVESEAKGGIYLSILGFGMGNHNDAMLEKISGRGNGNYAFIDTEKEARKVLVDQTSGTLVTIAKNVKMQVEFNPMQVAAYRLIGYENRILAKEDFKDDKKDAGEIGAGHSVTALYELVPAGMESDTTPPEVDKLTFQTEREPTEAAKDGRTMKLMLRYLTPDAVVEEGDESTLIEIPVIDDETEFAEADSEFRFAAAVAGFGMKLRRSKYAGSWTLSDVLNVAESSGGKDKYELRAEFADMVRKASELMGEQ